MAWLPSPVPHNGRVVVGRGDLFIQKRKYYLVDHRVSLETTKPLAVCWDRWRWRRWTPSDAPCRRHPSLGLRHIFTYTIRTVLTVTNSHWGHKMFGKYDLFAVNPIDHNIYRIKIEKMSENVILKWGFIPSLWPSTQNWRTQSHCWPNSTMCVNWCFALL